MCRMSVSISLASISSSHITPCLLRNVFSFYVPSYSFSFWSYFLCLYFISSFFLYTLFSMFSFPNFIRRIFFFRRLSIFVFQSPTIDFCLCVVHIFFFSTSFFHASPSLFTDLFFHPHFSLSLYILPFPALFTIISTISFLCPVFSLFCLRNIFPNDYCHMSYHKEYSQSPPLSRV